MTTVAPPPVQAPPTPPPSPQLRRVVVGLLVVAAGIGLLLDNAGVSVPWHVLPAVGVVLVGLTLIVAAVRGQRTRGLVGLGLVLVLVALVAGSNAAEYVGPFGDRQLSPTAAQWPVDQKLTAGSVVIDLTEHALPPSGRLSVRVGAGEILLRLPSAEAARVAARVTLGEVTVGGRSVQNGYDLRWSGGPESSPVRVDLRVGTGTVEVTYASSPGAGPS